MKTIRFKHTLSAAILSGLFISASVISQPTQLPPPEYSMVDKLGIDVTTLTVNTDIPTLAIGGAMGLSHKVTSHSNSFFANVEANTRGFKEMYEGGARFEKVFDNAQQGLEPYGLDCFDWAQPVHMMVVHDHESSQMFYINGGSASSANCHAPYPSVGPGTAYTALRDKRHTLEVPFGRIIPVSMNLSNESNPLAWLLWTKPDGTEVWIYRGMGTNITSATGGRIKKIVYPNGFSLDIFQYYTSSVTTNTGFQLKYNYPADGRPPIGIGSGYTYPGIPPENDATWSIDNPASIVGVNMAFERCSIDMDDLCVPAQSSCNEIKQGGLVGIGQSCAVLTNEWPMAKFTWPRGIPRALYFGNNQLTVTNADNQITKLSFAGYDPCVENPTALICNQYPAGFYRVPRITGVTYAGSTSESVSYGYLTEWHAQPPPSSSVMDWYGLPSDVGYLSSVSGVAGANVYVPASNQQYEGGQNPYSMYRRGYNVETYTRTDLFGALVIVDSIHTGHTRFEVNFRNLPLYQIPVSGPRQDYEYDNRGNLTKITYNKNMPSETYVEAQFPTSCTTTNRKYCNKAEWISDAKGNVTSYTYHSQSGQIETITSPADADGKIAQTRFEYQQKQARYLNESNVYTYGSPIWLKTAEKHCIDSNFANGSCANNDEVVTTYAYDSDNLFLTSVTVTAPNNSFRRTCYEYDKYGNQIGETQPEGNCN